jgi:hypothetical protein
LKEKVSLGSFATCGVLWPSLERLRVYGRPVLFKLSCKSHHIGTRFQDNDPGIGLPPGPERLSASDAPAI